MLSPLKMDCGEGDPLREDVAQSPQLASECTFSWMAEMDRLHEKLDKLIAGQERIAYSMQHVIKRQPGMTGPKFAHSSSNVSHHVAQPRICKKSTNSTFGSSPKGSRDIFELGNQISVKLRDFTPRSGRENNPLRFMPVATYNYQNRIQRDTKTPKITKKLLNMIPLMPSDPLVTCLDGFSLLLLFYDCLMIPYILAWDAQPTGFFRHIAWAAAIFWTMDLLLQFVKAYTKGVEVVTDLRIIAFHYLRCRFLLDVAIVTIDWIAIILEMSDGSFGSVATPAKAFRILKIGRVLRIVSVLQTDKVASMQEFVIHWAYIFGIDMFVSLSGNLMKLILAILYLNHVASCVWVAIQAGAWKDTARSWEHSISKLHNGDSFSDAGLSDVFQYFTAYYWSVSSMFSGASTLQPMNTTENIYASGYVLCGVLFASCIISTMSAMLIQINEINRGKKEQMRLLSRFLQQRNVDAVTSILVQRQALERMEQPKRITENDVSSIRLLSSQLREQLRFIVLKPALMAQPLLRTCAYVDEQVVQMISKFAITSLVCTPGFLIFDVGDQVQESYIAVSGDLLYGAEHELAEEEILATHRKSQFCGTGSEGVASEADIVKVTVQLHQHVCEIALWAEWTCLGSLEAASTCEVLACSATALIEKVFPCSPQTLDIMKRYATALLAFIQKEKKVGLSDLCSDIDYDAIVSLMPQEERVLMSMPFLTALKKKREALSSRKQLAKLEQEIREGACNLGLNEAGEISRTVRVVVLRMKDPDGRLCVKLGDWQENEFSMAIELPGSKTMKEETLDDCKNRILNRYFPDLIPHVLFDDLRVDVSTKPSKDYGIPTKYIRTVLHAQCLQCEADSHRPTTAKVFDWKGDQVVCFASVQSEHDRVRSSVFAWMEPSVHMDMIDSCDTEECVAAWADGFRIPASSTQVVGYADLVMSSAAFPNIYHEGDRVLTFL